jgi:hypothetical protein
MSSTNNIPIETGNPFGTEAQPASYSRFILPFAYIEIPELNGWERDTLENKVARESYFTAETSQVIFKQAKYYKIKNWNFPPLKYLDNEISLNAPKIVLFEVESKSVISEKDKKPMLKTGFLILELYFAEYFFENEAAITKTKNDNKKKQVISFEYLLEINELFRYKTKPYQGHNNPLSIAFNYKLEKYLGKTKECEALEYSHWQRLLNSFFGNSFGDKWDIYADDRAFVWTCAVTKNGATDLKSKFYPISSDKWQAENYGHWVKLLNVDKPDVNSIKTHPTTVFERQWANERTYERWEESGSFYGFSYHSGAALLPRMEYKKKDGTTVYEPPLWKYFGEMYFDMFLLLLYTRVTVFRFSNRLTEISVIATKKENIEANVLNWRTSFENLRWEFTLFTNLYQFPLISNQQQMIEMYAIARKYLDIQELYNEVKEEIHNNQEFIEQRIAKAQSESSLDLTRIATLGLAFSIGLAFVATDLAKNISESIVGETGYFRSWLYTENGWDFRWFILIFLSIFAFFGLRLGSFLWGKVFKPYWNDIKELFRRK